MPNFVLFDHIELWLYGKELIFLQDIIFWGAISWYLQQPSVLQYTEQKYKGNIFIFAEQKALRRYLCI